MKKLLFILLCIVVLSSCTCGENFRIPIENGNVRVTTTKNYVIMEVCIGSTAVGSPTWKIVSVDHIKVEEEK